MESSLSRSVICAAADTVTQGCIDPEKISVACQGQLLPNEDVTTNGLSLLATRFLTLSRFGIAPDNLDESSKQRRYPVFPLFDYAVSANDKVTILTSPEDDRLRHRIPLKQIEVSNVSRTARNEIESRTICE